MLSLLGEKSNAGVVRTRAYLLDGAVVKGLVRSVPAPELQTTRVVYIGGMLSLDRP